jgi:hypothetical protein
VKIPIPKRCGETFAVSDLQQLELELSEQVRDCYADPLRFVRIMFPWGEPGPLKDYDGPDDWQREYLIDLGRGGARTGI